MQYRQHKIAQERADAVEVDAWFAQFDQDGNNLLDREELRQLLKHLHPEREPTEKVLSMLLKKATEIDSYSIKLHGSENGTVSKDAAQATIKRFRAYYQEQECESERILTALRLVSPFACPVHHSRGCAQILTQ